MIKIIAVGSIKEDYLKEAIDNYVERIQKYTNIKIIEVKDEGTNDIYKNIKIEEERINKYIDPKDYVITLEIEGKELTSEEFAEKIRTIQISNSNITFIIGGSYGLSEEIKKKANYHLSFSKLTFPHQLFRVLLLEQIYRSYKINNNESYHK